MVVRFPRTFKVLVPLLILVGAAVAGAVREHFPAPETTVPRAVVLDIGQGDAILLDGPGDDAEVLIDGGPDATTMLGKLREHLGSDTSLNLVVLTHPHADHVAGLVAVLEHYDVERVLLTGAVHTTQTYRAFLERIDTQAIATTWAIAGDRLVVGPFDLDVLAPAASFHGMHIESINDSSIVLMAAVGAQRLLLTGDAETDVQRTLLDRGVDLRADVLKVAHHGAENGAVQEFLNAVAPRHAIISVGAGNDYGHPHRRALKRLSRTGAQLWRTDEQGDITVMFNEGLQVSAAR
ncbi:MAG: MBL fold metallo-hydrolase [bacterium]|nr:MBL fold metallo-hydrolase [bacterium]